MVVWRNLQDEGGQADETSQTSASNGGSLAGAGRGVSGLGLDRSARGVGLRLVPLAVLAMLAAVASWLVDAEADHG